MKRIILLPLIVLIIAVLAAVSWTLKENRESGADQTKDVGVSMEDKAEATESSHFVLADEGIEVKVDLNPIQPGGSDYLMQLALLATEGSVSLSSFAVKFDLLGENSDGDTTLEVDSKWRYNPVLTNGNWAFPISKVETGIGKRTTIKLAGVNMSPEVFNWKGKQVVATMPVKFEEKSDQVRVKVDTEQTKFFTKKAEQIPLAKQAEWIISLN